MLWFLICGLQSAAKYSSHCSEVHCIPTQLAQYLSQAGRLNHTRVALFVWNMSGLHGRWRIPCLCGAWEIPSTWFFLRLSHGQVRPKTATVWLALGNWEIHSSGNQKNERTSLTSGGLSCGASTGHLDLVFQCWLVSWSKFVLQNILEVNQRKGTESLASHKKNSCSRHHRSPAFGRCFGTYRIPSSSGRWHGWYPRPCTVAFKLVTFGSTGACGNTNLPGWCAGSGCAGFFWQFLTNGGPCFCPPAWEKRWNCLNQFCHMNCMHIHSHMIVMSLLFFHEIPVASTPLWFSFPWPKHRPGMIQKLDLNGYMMHFICETISSSTSLIRMSKGSRFWGRACRGKIKQ